MRCGICRKYLPANELIMLNNNLTGGQYPVHINCSRSIKETQVSEFIKCLDCGAEYNGFHFIHLCPNKNHIETGPEHEDSIDIHKGEVNPITFNEAIRGTVAYDYNAINPDFLEGLAMIAMHATEKYGSWEQYRNGRLTGNKAPLTHVFSHVMDYRRQRGYDRFDGQIKWHLIAAAYNLMMEFTYIQDGHSADTWNYEYFEEFMKRMANASTSPGKS